MLNTSRNYPTTSAYPIACKYIGESIRHHCVCNVLIWHIRHKFLQTINNSGYYVNFTVIDEPILTQCIIMIISGCGSMVLTHHEGGRYLTKDGEASEGLPISSGCRYSNHRKDFIPIRNIQSMKVGICSYLWGRYEMTPYPGIYFLSDLSIRRILRKNQGWTSCRRKHSDSQHRPKPYPPRLKG